MSQALDSQFRRRVNCEVCDHRLPDAILDLGLQPLCDDLVPIGEARQSPRYPIRISLCPTCLTAHQLYPGSKEVLFPSTYHYRPRFTQDVLNGMSDLVRECEEQFFSLSGKLVCDIGCNDGSLLTFFRNKNAVTVGIEPTGACDDAIAAGHRAFKEYFSPEVARKLVATVGIPDVITLTNVFAHIESLDEAIAALREMSDQRTLLVIENHYLGSIIQSNQFDTFYHEHPRTYSIRSFEHIAGRLGAQVLHVSFPSRYGGNVRVFIGNFGGGALVGKDRPVKREMGRDESKFAAELGQMQTFVDAWKNRTSAQLTTFKDKGVKLLGKSFPGRAAILVSLLGIDDQLEPYLFEKPGSMKLGHYVPGTRIQIVSDEQWISNSVRPEAMIIWAWHISGEVAAYMRANGYRGKLFSPLPSFHEIV
jgi:hypothetical protein